MPPLIELYAPATIAAAFVVSSLVIFLFARRALLSLTLGMIGGIGAYVYWTADLLEMNLRTSRECGADQAQILARRTDVSAVLLPPDVSTLDPHALERLVATYDAVVTDGIASAGIPRQRWRPAAPSEFANYNNGKTRFVSVAVSEADLPRYRVVEQWSGPSEAGRGYRIESGEMRIEDRATNEVLAKVGVHHGTSLAGDQLARQRSLLPVPFGSGCRVGDRIDLVKQVLVPAAR
ncbi:MAG TPA: hypothetical protein VMV37_06715 [Gammaproteobacteria bacterium]|nr:hypothetical protein [Gammaproteobacteria bacterium]